MTTGIRNLLLIARMQQQILLDNGKTPRGAPLSAAAPCHSTHEAGAAQPAEHPHPCAAALTDDGDL